MVRSHCWRHKTLCLQDIKKSSWKWFEDFLAVQAPGGGEASVVILSSGFWVLPHPVEFSQMHPHATRLVICLCTVHSVIKGSSSICSLLMPDGKYIDHCCNHPPSHPLWLLAVYMLLASYTFLAHDENIKDWILCPQNNNFLGEVN